MAALGAERQQRAVLTSAIADCTPEAPSRKDLLERASRMKDSIKRLEKSVSNISLEMETLALELPNGTHPDTPLGPYSNARLILQCAGSRGIIESHEAREHLHIGRGLGLIDLEAGSRVTGSSWAYLLSETAILEQALISYALTLAHDRGYTLVSPPDVIKWDVAQRCGFKPREERTATQQMYSLGPSHSDLVLSGTAEIPLAGLYADTILDLCQNVVKMTAFGRAFRVEAGARGKDTKGLYRLHQFSKVEMFAICSDTASDSVMEDMLTLQLDVIRGLGIPFRVLDMPTEELGASAYRKYDIEAWMPGRGSWGEISSLSNCTDYQSRRLHIRYREDNAANIKQPLPFAHTLNGTVAAIPRLIVALVENGVVLDKQSLPIALELPLCLKAFWIGTPNGRLPIKWI